MRSDTHFFCSNQVNEMCAKSGQYKNKNSRVAPYEFHNFFLLLSFCLCIIFTESRLHAPFSHAAAESSKLSTQMGEREREIEKTKWNEEKKVRHFSF